MLKNTNLEREGEWDVKDQRGSKDNLSEKGVRERHVRRYYWESICEAYEGRKQPRSKS